MDFAFWLIFVCGVCDMCDQTGKTIKMAPSKQLSVCASCTIKLHYLHPKNKVKEKIPNQTASQSLSGLIVQGREEQLIRKEQKLCVVFCDEGFGRKLVWALQRYTSSDIEGPSATFFEVKQHKQVQVQEVEVQGNNRSESTRQW